MLNKIGQCLGYQVKLWTHDWAKDAAGTYRATNERQITGMVEVWVDAEKLVALVGNKALKSKSGRTKLQAGAVTIILRQGTRKETPCGPN